MCAQYNLEIKVYDLETFDVQLKAMAETNSVFGEVFIQFQKDQLISTVPVGIQLYPEQENMKNQWLEVYAGFVKKLPVKMSYDGAINNSMSIAAPTSFGKTVILSFIEKELLLSKAERVLIVTSKINNNASMFKMMRRILPENIHIYQFDSSSKDKQRVIEMGDVPKPCIICCCYASLSHLPTTLIFNRLHVDEADEYRTLLNTIKRMLDGKKISMLEFFIRQADVSNFISATLFPDMSVINATDQKYMIYTDVKQLYTSRNYVPSFQIDAIHVTGDAASSREQIRAAAVVAKIESLYIDEIPMVFCASTTEAKLVEAGLQHKKTRFVSIHSRTKTDYIALHKLDSDTANVEELVRALISENKFFFS